MNNQELETVSHALAVYAVKGDRSGLEKQADVGQYLSDAYSKVQPFLSDAYAKAQPYLANPYVRNSLLGLGAGGLIGALQPKRKLRNALTYGLVGGLGGLGLTQAFNSAAAGSSAPKPPPADDGMAWDKENPNFTRTFENAPVVPTSSAQAMQQVGAVLNHPVSAFRKVRELLDDPDTYKGLQSEYVDPAVKTVTEPVQNAANFAGSVMNEHNKNMRNVGEAIGSTYGKAVTGVQDAMKFRDAVRDAHMQRMHNAGEAIGTTYGNAVNGVQNAARDASRFGRSVMDEHNKNMQNLGENYLYPAVKPLYNAGSAISNWWNGR